MKGIITQELTKSARIQKHFGVVYMCLVGLMWGAGIYTFPLENKSSLGFLLLNIAFWMNVYSLIMMLIINLDTTKRLLPIYIVVISLLLFPNLLMSSFLRCNGSLLFAMVNMVSITVIYSGRRAFYWNVFIFIQVAVAILLAKTLGATIVAWVDNPQLPSLHLIFDNNATFNAIVMFLLFLGAAYAKMRYADALEREFADDKEPPPSRSDEQYFKLYEQIVRYFDDKKPYLSTKFSASALAGALHCNTTYISQAIKIHKKMNFNAFVNIYRIKKAIELMQEDDEKKYTLQYIYQNAGFKSQATFNRVFKQITGFTPSDYLLKER